MRKILTPFLGMLFLLFYTVANAQTTIRMYNNEMFWGGYAALSAIPDSLPPGEGVTRLKTSLVTKKFKDSELDMIGDRLSMKILLQAACDNYDRGGQVALALVRKGDTGYAPTRFEIARFITPFMDKNKKPDTVPYEYELNHVAMLLKEKSIRDSFDIWCEFEIFGTPGDAWVKIAGCSTATTKRSDVFYGTIDFTTSGSHTVETNNILIPLANKFNLNMKKAGQSDTIGLPEKTFSFTLPTKSYYTRAFLITTSHGAGSGGEEYNRRQHQIYLDGTPVYDYVPGFETCEPYRKYNTQANGIYGSAVKTNEQWQSFSNWCPGAFVPTRVINLGTLEAGAHNIKLSVPDALFPNSDDRISTSLFIQGKDETYTGMAEDETIVSDAILFPNPATDRITVTANSEVKLLSVYSLLGKELLKGNAVTINIAALESGLYIVRVEFENGQYTNKPFIKR